MADVHYFPRYTQRENFVTNNTLLLFQRLYDYNLRKFGRFLMELDENLESYSSRLGLHINQQIRTGNSVPDGFIIQHPLKIIVETKMHEGFSESQLRRHLDTNSNQELSDLVLMLLSPQGEPDGKMVKSLRNKVAIVITSFREIIDAASDTGQKKLAIPVFLAVVIAACLKPQSTGEPPRLDSCLRRSDSPLYGV